MECKNIVLKPGKEESLKRFHPWVFSGAIKTLPQQLQEGELVRVLNSKGEFVAVGHYQVGSIAVRVLSFQDIDIDDDFYRKRLRSALDVRKATGIADNPQNNTYRLVHGEGDGLPGLVVDCYGHTAVLQAHSVGMHLVRQQVARVLVEVMEGRIENVFYKSETTLPFKGLRFRVDWLKGQKTGFFVDQRENRRLLERYAKDRKVLNMFCYTGGFSFYALRGGAQLVHSVDSSAKAVELTKENVELNFPGDPRHVAFCEDAFRFLDRADGQYDLIILDPPAFAKHRAALHNALKGYTRLNAKAFERIMPGGLLFTFSCSQVVTKDNFRNAVFTAAAQARRRVRILHQLHQPADHPVDIYHPEGEYLKGLVLYVE